MGEKTRDCSNRREPAPGIWVEALASSRPRRPGEPANGYRNLVLTESAQRASMLP
jgi:hypothetical protein